MANAALRSNQIFNTAGIRYAVALLATAAALLCRFALNPVLGGYVPYITLIPTMAFCGWYCGPGPTIFSALIAIAGAQYWFIYPFHSLAVVNVPQAVAILSFSVTTAVLIVMGENRRRRENLFWTRQGELESAVKERTAELDKTNQNLRELSARLMQLQDDERRRLARELHDSVGQTLAALGMNLAAVGTDIDRLLKTAATVNSSAALVQELSREIRTISYLLHPPLLDDAGLGPALHWYVDGFAERSEIKVELEISKNFPRLNRESETAIFRTVQECLTNIHRHSGSPKARIRLTSADGQVCVEVEDSGSGISPEKQLEMASMGTPGVGIRGMRERLRQLGGSVDIQSNAKGTQIMAKLPISPDLKSSVAV